MATLPDTTRRALRILDTMRKRGELTPPAVERLRGAMLAGEDAYPYYSIDGRPFVWSDGRRFTAPDYSEGVGESVGEPGDTGADREPMIDKLERFLFGASARESVEMRIRLAQQRIEQRIIAALESDGETPDGETPDGEAIETRGE